MISNNDKALVCASFIVICSEYLKIRKTSIVQRKEGDDNTSK